MTIGRRVNVFDASPDAEYILDEGEDGGEWREARFSVGWFKRRFDFSNFLKGFTQDDEKRVSFIIDRLNREGVRSIDNYPVLILWPQSAKHVEMIDGWHRLISIMRMGLGDRFMVPAVVKLR